MRVGMTGASLTSGNSEEEMYKELFINFVQNTFPDTTLTITDNFTTIRAGTFGSLSIQELNLPNFDGTLKIGTWSYPPNNTLVTVRMPKFTLKFVGVFGSLGSNFRNLYLYAIDNSQVNDLYTFQGNTLSHIYFSGMTASQLKACSKFPFANTTYFPNLYNCTFHGNDGNKITWDSSTSEWIISPDVSNPLLCTVSNGGGGYKLRCVRRSHRRFSRHSTRFCAAPWRAAA